jgi:trehalose utilization protein
MKTTLASILLCLGTLTAVAEPIRVLVWDEQQPQQKEAYGEKFLGETIAAHLEQQSGLSVKTARLDEAEQGLSDATLEHTDVLVFWCHRRVKEQDDARMEAVVKRVLDGKLSLIALHSAHWAKPFVRLMQERAKADALQQLPEAERASAKWEFVNEQPYYKGVKNDAPLTPALAHENGVWKLALPAHWDIPQTEMYGEPFHVPAPDEVVFEESWDKGEHFRSGCVWNVGKGRVFYFRPGHEIYPIFKQAEPLKVVENAARWLGGK